MLLSAFYVKVCNVAEFTVDLLFIAHLPPQVAYLNLYL